MPPCHTGEEAYGKKDDVLLVFRKKVQIVSIAHPMGAEYLCGRAKTWPRIQAG